LLYCARGKMELLPLRNLCALCASAVKKVSFVAARSILTTFYSYLSGGSGGAEI
jgi:hypothetical protein